MEGGRGEKKSPLYIYASLNGLFKNGLPHWEEILGRIVKLPKGGLKAVLIIDFLFWEIQ